MADFRIAAALDSFAYFWLLAVGVHYLGFPLPSQSFWVGLGLVLA